MSLDYRKLYTYRLAKWLWHIWRKDKLLITYSVDVKSKRFDEELVIAHVSQAQAYAMGFTRGKNIKDEIRYLPFKTYVKFRPDIHPPYPLLIVEEDGTVHENYETSSTLYDHWKSDAQKNFIAGMTKTVLTAGVQKKLVLMLAICAVAAVGLYLILFR